MLINKNWILLDSCTTHSCTNNMELIKDLRDFDETEKLWLNTNGGPIYFDKKGIFKIIPAEVYFNKSAIATVLGMKDVLSVPGVRVVYDSAVKRSFYVEYDEEVFEFVECSEGLYYYSPSKKQKNSQIKNNKETVDFYSGVQCVADNERMFHKKDLTAAKAATIL